MGKETIDSGLRDTTLGLEHRAMPLPWGTLSILKDPPACLVLVIFIFFSSEGVIFPPTVPDASFAVVTTLCNPQCLPRVKGGLPGA